MNDWRDDAACKGRTGLFYPLPFETKHAAEAKAICAGCPVRQECLNEAVADHEFGIWGGTSWRDRQRLRDGERKIPRNERVVLRRCRDCLTVFSAAPLRVLCDNCRVVARRESVRSHYLRTRAESA